MDEMVLKTQNWLNETYGGRSGYNSIDLSNKKIQGHTGWTTMYALTRALQIELGISVPSDNFGTGTLSALSRYGNIGTGQNDSNQNIVKIIQGGLYCKGYSAGGITGTFGEQTSAAVVKMKQNMGVSAVDGLVTPKFFKALLTMDAYVLLSGGKTEIREIQQWLNNRYYTRKNYFFQPCDGYYSRNTQKALLFALQYEEGLDDATANGRFGPTTKSKLPTLTRGNSDSSTKFVHLLQAALIFNNRACPFHGAFDAMTLTAVLGFQNFTKLTVSGTVGKQTWASLLVSTGDPTRRGTACDCITEVTAARAQLLKENGYTTVGRYLTNVKNSSLNKKIQKGELKTITDAGLSVFPIFQTYGGSASYFGANQGMRDALEAYFAAKSYGFPKGTIIYFAIDFDTTENDISSNIIPHFQGINKGIKNSLGEYYRIGVYGTRNACQKVSNQGLAVASFLSDMSTGYSGNLGFAHPGNWAFDQISTINLKNGSANIQIDNDIQSGLDNGVSQFDEPNASGTSVDDVEMSDSRRIDLKREVVSWFEKVMNDVQKVKASRSRENAMDDVFRYDRLITALSNRYRIRKALIQTAFAWEHTLEGLDDLTSDSMVTNYYAYKEQLEQWENLSAEQKALIPRPVAPALVRRDSSTGLCQIFAATAIKACNYAISIGLIHERSYDQNNWHDLYEVWKKLHNDGEYNLSKCALVLMHSAYLVGLGADYYNYGAAEVKAVLARYNGTNEKAREYGERNYGLYQIFEKYNALER